MIRCGLRIFPRGGLYQEISGRARDFFCPPPLEHYIQGGGAKIIARKSVFTHSKG